AHTKSLSSFAVSPERADRQKNEFLAILSHELRTHLNAILGWTHLMRESRENEAIISQGLDVLQRNTETLTEVISDLLDMSKIATGTLTLDFKEVDLKKTVSSSVETLSTQAAEKGIALTSSVEAPQEVSCKVWADEARLHQILANLLSNALKFTPRGGSVGVQLKKTHASAIVVVKDTGKGISPEFLPHIFERFSQQEASSGENRGFGMGLAISKYLVELHGGSISAESEGLGCGATIRFELPVMTCVDTPAAELPIARDFNKAKGVLGPRLKSIKVVAVDDDADSRELLKTILERDSAEATVVGSGQEALAAIKHVHPDVVICDLTMSEMDGYQLLENIRALESEVARLPVIAFTAAARNEDRARTRRAGFQAHLSKPIHPCQLFSTIFSLS